MVRYSPAIEAAIERLLPFFAGHAAARGLAINVLAGDETLLPWLEGRFDAAQRRTFDTIREETQAQLNEPVGYSINRARIAAVDGLLADVFTRPVQTGGGFRQWLGAVSMHPLWGVPVLGFVLWLAWWFVGNLGAGTMVDFVENSIFNAWINPWAIRLLDLVLPFTHSHIIEEGVITAAYSQPAAATGFAAVSRFTHDLLVGPYGVITMALTYAIAIVLPVVTTFFIFFGLMEDSGYLPRSSASSWRCSGLLRPRRRSSGSA
jgi:ferrous iron transport protein B